MHSIEIDDDLMGLLTQNARPFVDTPNSVLRRLLLPGSERKSQPTPPETPEATVPYPSARSVVRSHTAPDPEAFVAEVLRQEFGERFRVRSPFRMMFESDQRLVYFQNFNASATSNLWFRLNARPMQVLRSSRKTAFVCLTNPADRYAFLVPLADIDAHAKANNWSRPELEVNIDPSTFRWREFNWNLTKYRKCY